MTDNTPEIHPLPPFLPAGAKLLMLGSFPPPHERWSMEFYYPNLQNDMWRIFGLVFFGDKDHFLEPGLKRFSKERLVAFLTAKGIALSDTAASAIRHRGNASDQFLEVVEHRDIAELLAAIPECRAVVTTGGKATETLAEVTGSPHPAVGGFSEFGLAGHTLRHYRMPSSSRAYPKPLAEKAEAYAEMFRREGLL
ncbi:uracil-DNA glycosylase family protein [Alistipes sp. OttesenSCG-928-B03]|nr:uracil-DNA glycosylase family protein [Alistipes sp. OttesenSCG-928-B03]